MGKNHNSSLLPTGFPPDFYIKFHQLVGDIRRLQKLSNSILTMKLAMQKVIGIPNFGVIKLNVGPPAILPQVTKDLWTKEIHQTYFQLIKEHWAPFLEQHFLDSKIKTVKNMEVLLSYHLSASVQSNLLLYLHSGAEVGHNSYSRKLLKLYFEGPYSNKLGYKKQLIDQYQGTLGSKEIHKALLRATDWFPVGSFSSFDILLDFLGNLSPFPLTQPITIIEGELPPLEISQVLTRGLSQNSPSYFSSTTTDIVSTTTGKLHCSQANYFNLEQSPGNIEVINLITPDTCPIDLSNEDEEIHLAASTFQDDCADKKTEQTRRRISNSLILTPKRKIASMCEEKSPLLKQRKIGGTPPTSPPKPKPNCPKIDEKCISSKVHWIKGDGNCLFRSLALGVYNCQDFHYQVRSKITLFLARHEHRFAPFFYPERIPGSNVIPRDFSHYVEILSLDGVYGGALEITAAAEIWSIGIWVFTGMDQLHSVWDEFNEIYLGLRYTLRAKHYELIDAFGSNAYRIFKDNREWRRRLRADRERVIDLSTPSSAASILTPMETTEINVSSTITNRSTTGPTHKPVLPLEGDTYKLKQESVGKFFPIPQHDTPLRRRMQTTKSNREAQEVDTLLSPSPWHFEKTEVLPSIPEVVDLMDIPDDMIVTRITKMRGKKRRTILNLVRQYFQKRKKIQTQDKVLSFTQASKKVKSTCSELNQNQLLTLPRASAESAFPNVAAPPVRAPGQDLRDIKPTLILSSIFNFSSYNLNQGEIQLLTKGLTFSPSTKTVQQTQLQIDLFKFCRNIRLKKHFELYPSPFSCQSKHVLDVTHKFNMGSTFDPESSCKFLNTYIEGVRTDMETLAKRKINSFDNLNIEEREALRTLIDKIHNKEISIVMADKGGGIVLLDYIDYRDKGDQYFLDSHESYSLCGVTEELITKSILKARTLVINNLLSSKVILPRHRKFGENKLYSKITGIKFLIKVHKSLNLESIPLRPIHPSIGSPNHNLSLLLDGLINPYVNSHNLPTLLRDTNQLLFFLRELVQLPPNIIIATSDITSLYTNIPHVEGIRILSDFLSEFSAYSPTQVSAISDAVKHVVTLNYLKWQHLIYKQVRGVAMGTPVAVSYANIFMGAVDKALSIKAPYIFKHFRFIDDNLFLVPRDRVSDLQQAFKELDFPTIQSTWTVDLDNEGISFLDVWLSIKDNQIHSRLFTKPTDRHLYLHPQSYHPRHTITNIPYSILSRVRRLCSEEQTYTEDKNKALQWLRERGYDEELLTKTIINVEERTGIQHIRAIEDKHKSEVYNSQLGAHSVSPNTIIPLTLTYSAQLKRAPFMLFRHRHTLAATLKQPHRTLVAFRRNKNLADLLVHPSYREHFQKREDDYPVTLGFSHCRKKLKYRLSKCICGLAHSEGCRVCAHSVEGLSRLPKTKHKILVNQKANCHTRNVVYAIWCRVCAKIYVGETTQPLSTRLDQHLRLMRSSMSTEVLYQHFRNHHPSNAFITPLEVIRQLEPKILQIKESKWINKLGSLIPNGLNTQLDLNQRYRGDFMGVSTKTKVTATPTPTRAFLGNGDSTPRSTSQADTQASGDLIAKKRNKRTLYYTKVTPNIQRSKIQTPSFSKGVSSNRSSTKTVVVTPWRKQHRTPIKEEGNEESEPFVQISPFIFASPKRRGTQCNLSRQRVFKS